MAEVKVMSYNILADELTSNFVPRTMEDPPETLLADIFSAAPGDAMKQWADLKSALNDEYKKWHPLKTWIETPSGVRIKARGLWGELDLSKLQDEGWKLDGVEVQDAVTLSGNTTFLGIVKRSLDDSKSLILYNALRKVQVETRAWDVRGPRILKKIKETSPSLLALEEYDVHDLPTSGHASFKEAMHELGYEGANFLGPGQEKSGVALFWSCKCASIAKDTPIPTDGFIPSGMETPAFGNIDLKEPGIEKPMDRRPLAYVKLVMFGQPVVFCGTHLMTGSRDRTGAVRSQELVNIRQLLRSRIDAGSAVFLCGDFNINSHNFAEEHIWKGEGIEGDTGYARDASGANRFQWERADGGTLCLRDAYDCVYGSKDCSSTRTGTRLETIDYIFFDEDLLQLVEGSLTPLCCPAEPMPNEKEPSDHIAISASFKTKTAR
eukprot:TRINITY_DN94790_c0_g1_i1.p1 TRINITY_DN94790_c0_g1~~TRINITY_DN94790_c0_g1_i1.p1  ORF type:complete len:456 (-),score=71.33 TRINITY_DN94790_c0_g1_i1:13-1320(-)